MKEDGHSQLRQAAEAAVGAERQSAAHAAVVATAAQQAAEAAKAAAMQAVAEAKACEAKEHQLEQERKHAAGLRAMTDANKEAAVERLKSTQRGRPLVRESSMPRKEKSKSRSGSRCCWWPWARSETSWIAYWS